MRTIYIGGSNNVRKGGVKWKLYMFLFVFLGITISVLKVTAPTIVEKWINKQGAESTGFAFSIRDSELSLSRGQIVLNDVKIFNRKTKTEILEAPRLTIKADLTHFFRSQEKTISIEADKVDLTLSKDFASEIRRIQEMDSRKHDLYFSIVEGKIGKLNIIEKKEDQSRTVVDLKEVSFSMKEFTPLSITKKSHFAFLASVVDGGKLDLSGKTAEAEGFTSWAIKGNLKQVPSDILNKIAGNKLPFSFNENRLNAEITAHSSRGEVSGEFSPEVKKLNLIDEKPGIPTQTIARMLTEELTFTLPFTLKDDLVVEYADTFSKLKNYRKYAGTSERASPGIAPVSPSVSPKKSSFWPF